MSAIKDYDQLVYNIIKPLVLANPSIKVYRNVIKTDPNSEPEDYIVYSSGVSNVPRVFGDGKVILRRCNCDITVNETGTGNNDNAGYLVKLVEEQLIAQNIPYTKVDLGYIEATDSIQTTFDFYLI